MPKEDKIEIVSERNTVGLDLRNVQIAFDHIAIVHKKILARNFKCFIVKSWIFLEHFCHFQNVLQLNYGHIRDCLKYGHVKDCLKYGHVRDCLKNGQ